MAGYSRHFLAFAEIDLEWGRCFFAGPRQCQAVERLKNVVGHNNESSAFVAPWKELLHCLVHSLALATINYAHCSYTKPIVYSKLDLGTMIAPLKGKHKDIDSFVVHTTTTNTQLLDFALAICIASHKLWGPVLPCDERWWWWWCEQKNKESCLMVTGREIKWGVVLSRHQSKHTKLDFQVEKTFVQYIWCLYSYTIYMLPRTSHGKPNLTCKWKIFWDFHYF